MIVRIIVSSRFVSALVPTSSETMEVFAPGPVFGFEKPRRTG